MGATLKVLAILLTFGYITCAQFYDFSSRITPPQRSVLSQSFQPIWSLRSSFDHDAEEFAPEQRTEGPNAREKPFEVDVITSEVPHRPSGIGFPAFFNIPIFSSLDGFGFESGLQPWWKGENVCTQREEDEELAENEENSSIGSTTETNETPARFLGGFHFSLKSCVEKHNKYICTRTVNQNGKKKTLTIKRECCHGYGRPRNGDPTTPCSKIEIKSMEDTAADMGVKEFINGAMRNGLEEMLDKNVTLFAPIDRAYSEYADQWLNENNLVVSSDQSGMAVKSLIQNHLVDKLVSLDDVSNDDVFKTKSGESSIRINAYQMPLGVATDPFKYTANCAPILKHDKLTGNGLLHTVEQLIPQAKYTVMELIKQRDDMSVMQTVLEKTKLSKILEGSKPVTIFVPTDSAFEKLDHSMRKSLKEGKGCASNMMKSHILDLTFCSAAAVAGTRTSAYNLLGEQMLFNRSSSTSEISDLSGVQQVMINGIARIIQSDIMGTNGVVHVIDNILPTPTALPITALMKEKNVTVFQKLIEAADVQDEFNDMDNVTIFAPTDKAFEGSEWVKALKEYPENLKNNEDLKNFLSYHVVRPKTKTCDLSEQLLTTASDAKLRVNLYSTHALFPNVMNRATVNCARLVHFDDESCGSVLHQVDKILSPPESNLLKMLESNPNYSKFLELVRSVNLTNLLEDANEGYTLLVPKNDVFEEMEGLPENKSEKENLVKRHIVNDVVCCAGIIPTNWPFVRTIESLDGSHLRITRDQRHRIENAGITKCDKVATNGIIHEINDIITPRKH